MVAGRNESKPLVFQLIPLHPAAGDPNSEYVEGDAARRCCWPWMACSAASSPSLIASGRRRRTRSATCARQASRSSWQRATAAEAVARQLGIDEVRAEASPGEKAALVAQIRARGLSVAMAGDGVNDAPALAAADVGIAMGTSADVVSKALA